MKSKSAFLVFSVLLASLQVIVAQPLRPVTIKNLPADPDPQSNRYTLFSFARGEVVPLKEMETDQWDLGFKGTSIIVNGGGERKGKGGAFLVNGAFDALEKLPENTRWHTDEPEKPAIPAGSGNGWYEYVFTTHEIKPLPNRVLLIRTAAGNYAKVEIISYYRDIEGETDAPGRYYTFRYVYQPDGTGKF